MERLITDYLGWTATADDVLQALEQCHCISQMLHCPSGISGKGLSHAKQIKRFRHALSVLQALKRAQCLVVGLHALFGLPRVRQPVP